ncbi:Endonuclease/exonuclease/phosphatase [Armillaria novae-zelandiae]|uniref:Endonuclease/exonuclease/phosphatase n=1 Tax=Armillaria novae-zelandiae TaxID=153914 RepID=A0AA39UEW7_9AGAR|nr:Endonuclease/exonuclease/phosphatase [Armillaria novae-zelandiae]
MDTGITKVARALSYCNLASRKWIPIPSPSKNLRSQVGRSQVLHSPKPTPCFSLITWNVDGFGPYRYQRTRGLLECILHESRRPDILFLQEVTRDVRAALLGDSNVRQAFFTTDAEDDKVFGDEDRGYATMTLLSRKRFAPPPSDDVQKEEDEVKGEEKFVVGSVSRVKLPSKFGRDGLCVDISPPSASTFYRLINVHLDSVDNLPNRIRQMEILAKLLRESGCSGGLIAGDFNSVGPGDDELVSKHGLVDAWLALHGDRDPEAPTWSAIRRLEKDHDPRRLDKVALLGFAAEEMEILHPGTLDGLRVGANSKPVDWSDHSGLRCTFTV